MDTSTASRHQPPHARRSLDILPAFADVARFGDISGLGRSYIYELLAAGKLTAIKAGRRTLIDVRAGLDFLRTLPPAKISPPQVTRDKRNRQ